MLQFKMVERKTKLCGKFQLPCHSVEGWSCSPVVSQRLMHFFFFKFTPESVQDPPFPPMIPTVTDTTWRTSTFSLHFIFVSLLPAQFTFMCQMCTTKCRLLLDFRHVFFLSTNQEKLFWMNRKKKPSRHQFGRFVRASPSISVGGSGCSASCDLSCSRGRYGTSSPLALWMVANPPPTTQN